MALMLFWLKVFAKYKWGTDMYRNDYPKYKPILSGWSLENVDPDHYFVIWFIYNAELITPATKAKGWCVYREIELDF